VKIVIAALSAPSSLNGVSRHAANLARALLSLPDSPEVHFLAGDWQREMFPSAIASRHPQFHMHPIQIHRNNFGRLAWYYQDLPLIAEQLEADVVHMTCPAPVHASTFKCPTVVSLHDLYPFDIPGNFGAVKNQITRRLMRQCLMEIDAIACVSAYTESRLAQYFPEKVTRKAMTIPNAVEPISGASRAPESLATGRPFMLCIAQHRQNKNVPLALKIFARALQVTALSPDTGFLLLGIEGPETRRILQEIRALHLEDRVTMLSGISDQELLWCYRNCCLLLAPSVIEGFGLPIAEALIAGCPVVCSDIPPFREIGGDQCRYVGFGEGVLERYMEAIRQTLPKPRKVGAPIPGLAPASIAARYLDMYKRLGGFRGTLQNGMLRQPEAKSRKMGVPVA